MNPVTALQLQENNPPFFVKDCFRANHFLSFYNEKMSYASFPKLVDLNGQVRRPRTIAYIFNYRVYTCSGLLNLVATVSMVAVFVLGIIGMTGVLSPEILLLTSAGLLLIGTGAQWLREKDNSKIFDLVLTSLVSVTILILGCYLSQSALLTGSVLVGMTSLYALIGGIAPRLYHFYKLRHPLPLNQEDQERHDRFLHRFQPHRGGQANQVRILATPPSFFDVLTGREVRNQISWVP